MRLLWMKSDYVVPPDTGGKIRTFNLLKQLNQICDVTYLAIRADKLPPPETSASWASEIITVFRPEEVKRGILFALRVARRMLSRIPYVAQKYRAAQITSYQADWCRRHANLKDAPVVLCDFLEMAENVDWSTNSRKILFQHNVESEIWRRYAETEQNLARRAYFRFEYERMRRYETRTCNRFDKVLVVSATDRDTLRERLNVIVPIEVIETGVDTDFFAPAASEESVPGRLLFLGSLDWMPNIDAVQWFVHEVYPFIRQQHPGASLDIVGRRPVEKVLKLAKADESIRLVSDVPDVRPYISACDLFVVPLRVGGGTRIKIYEAMAMNRPVVSTQVGAEGLPLKNGEHIQIADSPHDFAQAVCNLLTDGDRKSQISHNGYSLVSGCFGWQRIAQEFTKACFPSYSFEQARDETLSSAVK